MNLEIQQSGINFTPADVEKKLKDYWKLEDKKIKDIDKKTTYAYYVTSEERIYFVINDGQLKGDFHISEVFDLKYEN